MTPSRKTTAGLVLLVLLVATALFSGASCGHSFPAEVRRKLEKVLDGVMEEHDVPGAVVGVWLPEGTWIEARGVSDMDTGEPMEVADRFRIGSVTKSFTSVLVLQLVDDGRVGLEDTLDRYVPRVPGSAGITVRELLNMTSGIYDYANPEDGSFDAIIKEEPLRRWTPDELVDLALAHPPYSAPGAGWHYSNTNYILLGMIVEQVTGNSIEEEMQRGIFEPLELSSSAFATGTSLEEPYSRGYIAEAEGGTLNDITELDPSQCWAAGAVVSDLEDLKTWARALGEGTLLERETYTEQVNCVKVPMGAIADIKYGLGVFYMGGFIGHEGMIPGYNCAAYHHPDKDATIVVLLNRYSDESLARRVFWDSARAVMPDDVPRTW